MLIASNSHVAHLFMRGIFMDSMCNLVKIKEYETGKGEDRSVYLIIFSLFCCLFIFIFF